jgi:pantoate--beta-alanine ligase
VLHTISTAAEMQRIALAAKRAGKRIGVVPTMGFLHDGHASLIHKARSDANVVIVTIFVNPLQFAPTEDLSRYPRDLERDTELAANAGADYLFTPVPHEMYPPGFDLTVSVGGVTAPFEGVSRPTHFNGVATVVAKLFLITQADSAFFGQKDYQQAMVVGKLIRDLAIPIQLVVCPTRRDADGVAMSSRNVYLSPEERTKAAVLYKSLQTAQNLITSGERRREALEECLRTTLNTAFGINIDYAAAADADTLEQCDVFATTQGIVLLLAVRFGTTRLIDNLVVR